MRLIDADALKYTMLYTANWLSGKGVEIPAVWKSDVDDMPTIDAVEVVRCRECKRWERLEFSPLHFCPEVHEFTDAEFFCKRGKRREEENNGE